MAPTTSDRASSLELTFAQRLKFFNPMLVFIMMYVRWLGLLYTH